MRLAIFGAGGIGSWLGSCLQEAGNDVTFIARGAHGDAMSKKGLRVSLGADSSAEQLVLEKVQVFPDTASAAAANVRVDCCILCVKTFQVREAAKASMLILDDNGFIVTTQNGVGAPHDAAAELGPGRVVGGSCKVMSFLEEPGSARVAGGSGMLCFGEVFDEFGKTVADAKSQRVEKLHEIVKTAKRVKVDIGSGGSAPNMWMSLWEKAVGMCSFGPVGALMRASLDAIASCEESKHVLRSAMLEVMHVAASSGNKIADDAESYVDTVLSRVPTVMGKGGTTSTARDVLTGKPSEIRELSGAIVQIAHDLGTRAPTHEFILASLLPQELRARGEYHYSLRGVPGGIPHVQARL